MYAGKVVTTHEQAINHIKWHGSGYIITDTSTDMGAYMISGRFNGGDTSSTNSDSLKFIAMLGYVAMIFDNTRNYVSTLAQIGKDKSTVKFLDQAGKILVPLRFGLNIMSVPDDCQKHKTVWSCVFNTWSKNKY